MIQEKNTGESIQGCEVLLHKSATPMWTFSYIWDRKCNGRIEGECNNRSSLDSIIFADCVHEIKLTMIPRVVEESA